MEYQPPLIPYSSTFYSIDTNVILDIWCPPEASMFSKQKMPELWDHMDSLVKRGRIIASKEVYDELERHAAPDLLDWLKDNKGMFVFDQAQVDKAKMVINNFYTKYKNGYKPEVSDAADPFVVATAMVNQAVVLTQENEQAPHEPHLVNKPTIPTVCSHYGIECVDIKRFIEREGFRLSMV